MTDPIPLNETESTLEEADRMHEYLDEADTLLLVARRLIWMSDGDGAEPTARMRPVIDTLNRADEQLDALLADFRAIIDAEESGSPPAPPRSRVH